MKIVFIDLHCNVFLMKPFNIIISKSKVNAQKYRFLLNYLLDNRFEIVNYISPSGSTLMKNLRVFVNSDLQRRIENNFVLKNNNFTPKAIKVIKTINNIDKDDIVIAFFHYKNQMSVLKDFSCFKIVIGNHFIRMCDDGNLTDIGVNLFVNEIDASKNEFIKKYFNINGVKSLAIPYVAGKRFVNKREFKSRKRKAMAIGTLATTRYSTGYENFVQWSGDEWVQPLRKQILDNAELLSSDIDSYISCLYEEGYKVSGRHDNIVKKIKDKYYNIFHASTQSKYTSFDMVNKFNEYMMFICPEEAAGVPGIGAVEGMACGTAYIGLNHEMYRDWGMVPGIHYIPYDGTLTDLVEKIRYYGNHIEELEDIAQKGYEFSQLHFTQEAVTKYFATTILEEYGEWRKTYDNA